MKRLHVINLEKMGGTEKIFLQYIKQSNDDKDVVFCVSNFVANEIQQELGHIPLVFVNRIFNAHSIKYPSFMRKLILQRKIECEKADAVIFWDFIPHLVRKISLAKTIYYDHGSSWRLSENRKVVTFFQQADACIAVSYASKRIIQERFALSIPVEVIKNTLPKPKIFSFDKIAPTAGHITLGTASRLVSLKCIGVSIMTIAELRNRGYDAKLLIAGKGPNEDALKQLTKKLSLQEYVTFLGFQNNLSVFYKSIDFYMSTSISESFGLSCMDALYHGVPCIYSMIDGQTEVITNGETGIGITPRISPEEYYNHAGYQVETPYFSYDPVNDKLIAPKIIDSLDCVDSIENIIINNTYSIYIENIKKYITNLTEESEVSGNINLFITNLISKNE